MGRDADMAGGVVWRDETAGTVHGPGIMVSGQVADAGISFGFCFRGLSGAFMKADPSRFNGWWGCFRAAAGMFPVLSGGVPVGTGRKRVRLIVRVLPPGKGQDAGSVHGECRIFSSVLQDRFLPLL